LNRYNKVAIWGASHQTFFVLSQMGDTSKISRIIDSAKFKQGRYSPVTHIPICVPSGDLPEAAVIVSAGSYSPEIVRILRNDYHYTGDIYVFDTDELKRCSF